MWRLADGSPVDEPLRGHRDIVTAVAMGRLHDGTPVAVSGSGDWTVRVWRLADGTPVGEALCGDADSGVDAVAAGALPDGTPVIISGGHDGTIWVWHTANGAPVMPSLDLPESVQAVAVHDNVIITVAGANIAVHQPALPRTMRWPSSVLENARPVKRPDNGRLSGTTRSPASDHLGSSSPPSARLGHVIRYIC
jgi:WD40 repeat protein